MTVLALDIATTTGFCHGAGDAIPCLGSFKLASTGKEIGPFLCEYQSALAQLLSSIEPEIVVFEAPAPSPNNPPITTRKLQGLAGVTEMVCFRRNIPTREVAPASVKKALTGNGRAKKPEMMASARSYGLRPALHDEADAFGVWLLAIRILAPEHALRWAPHLMGRAAA